MPSLVISNSGDIVYYDFGNASRELVVWGDINDGSDNDDSNGEINDGTGSCYSDNFIVVATTIIVSFKFYFILVILLFFIL